MPPAEDMTFTHGNTRLAGTLHLPVGDGPHPAVVMVPGSGDSDRDADGFFPPIREAFLEQGVAVLSWDKPGNGGSTGDWQQQTIRQRADEAATAIAWLRLHRAIDPARVGFWGQSQGGWIGPMVAASDPALWFLIIHSGTGVTVEEQDYFGLAETMRRAGATEAELTTGRAYMDALHQAAKDDMSYERFRDTIIAPARNTPHFDYFGEVGPGDWDFFRLNFAPDALFDPVNYLTRVTCPVLSIFGEKDRLIPVERSIEVLNETVAKSSPDLVIKVFPDGTHRLSRDSADDVEFVPGYFEFMRNWLSTRLASTSI